jgi:hypothetical protein
MVKKVVFIAAVMAMMLLSNEIKGDVSLVMNGSFENDGEIDPVTVDNTPQYWCDVDIPTDKFLCWVNTDWSTHGGYSLTFYSNIFVDFVAGDMAMISQQVYLEKNVNKIIFDLKLGTLSGDPWDPSKRSALVLIDGDIIWNSNDWPPDTNGEYRNQTVDINEVYIDENWHTLSLAMRSNVSQIEWFYEYIERWDFVKFDAYCGGFGFLWEDLNQDCYVNMLDLDMLVEQWLVEDPNEEYDLYQDGIIDFRDFAFFADYWMCNTYWENWQNDNCFVMELLAGDIDDTGEVNFGDIAKFADNWLIEGSCNRADLNKDGFVNFYDFAIIAEQWLQISWLYRLQ